MTTDAALCARTDPTLWHAEDHYARRRAVALCGRCDALAACIAYRDDLLAAGERLYGVWGGFDLGMDDSRPRVVTEVAA